MIKPIISTVFAIAIPLATAVPIGAQELLPVGQAARALADGRAWSAVTPDGRKTKMTFNADGTGSFEGPITMTTRWAVRGQEICIDLSVAGSRCLRFRRTPDGLQAYQGQQPDLRLSR